MDSSIVNIDCIKGIAEGTVSKLLIDVREPKELEETGTIPNSINIPLNTLEQALKKLSDEEFKTKFGCKKPEDETEIVVSCKMGGRSAKAQVVLRGLGYKKVQNYSGGWSDWEKNQQ